MAIRVIGILFFFLHRLDRLLDAAGRAHCNRIWGNVFGYNGSCTNCTTFTNTHTREYDHIGANPAIVFDENWMTKFNELLTGEYAGVMSRGQKAHASSDLDAIADHYQTRVQNSQAIHHD